MATLQIRVSDDLKTKADSLFSSLGLDTSTAVRIFLAASVENDGLPFPVKRTTSLDSLRKAIEDSRNLKNIHGPFDSATEAVNSMLED